MRSDRDAEISFDLVGRVGQQVTIARQLFRALVDEVSAIDQFSDACVIGVSDDERVTIVKPFATLRDGDDPSDTLREDTRTT